MESIKRLALTRSRSGDVDTVAKLTMPDQTASAADSSNPKDTNDSFDLLPSAQNSDYGETSISHQGTELRNGSDHSIPPISLSEHIEGGASSNRDHSMDFGQLDPAVYDIVAKIIQHGQTHDDDLISEAGSEFTADYSRNGGGSERQQLRRRDVQLDSSFYDDQSMESTPHPQFSFYDSDEEEESSLSSAGSSTRSFTPFEDYYDEDEWSTSTSESSQALTAPGSGHMRHLRGSVGAPLHHQPGYQVEGIQGSLSTSYEGQLLIRGDDDSATSVEEDPLFNASGTLREFEVPPKDIGKPPLLPPPNHNESFTGSDQKDLERVVSPAPPFSSSTVLPKDGAANWRLSSLLESPFVDNLVVFTADEDTSEEDDIPSATKKPSSSPNPIVPSPMQRPSKKTNTVLDKIIPPLYDDDNDAAMTEEEIAEREDILRDLPLYYSLSPFENTAPLKDHSAKPSRARKSKRASSSKSKKKKKKRKSRKSKRRKKKKSKSKHHRSLSSIDASDADSDSSGDESDSGYFVDDDISVCSDMSTDSVEVHTGVSRSKRRKSEGNSNDLSDVVARHKAKKAAKKKRRKERPKKRGRRADFEQEALRGEDEISESTTKICFSDHGVRMTLSIAERVEAIFTNKQIIFDSAFHDELTKTFSSAKPPGTIRLGQLLTKVESKGKGQKKLQSSIAASSTKRKCVGEKEKIKSSATTFKGNKGRNKTSKSRQSRSKSKEKQTKKKRSKSVDYTKRSRSKSKSKSKKRSKSVDPSKLRRKSIVGKGVGNPKKSPKKLKKDGKNRKEKKGSKSSSSKSFKQKTSFSKHIMTLQDVIDRDAEISDDESVTDIFSTITSLRESSSTGGLQTLDLKELMSSSAVSLVYPADEEYDENDDNPIPVDNPNLVRIRIERLQTKLEGIKQCAEQEVQYIKEHFEKQKNLIVKKVMAAKKDRGALEAIMCLHKIIVNDFHEQGRSLKKEMKALGRGISQQVVTASSLAQESHELNRQTVAKMMEIQRLERENAFLSIELRSCQSEHRELMLKSGEAFEHEANILVGRLDDYNLSSWMPLFTKWEEPRESKMPDEIFRLSYQKLPRTSIFYNPLEDDETRLKFFG